MDYEPDDQREDYEDRVKNYHRVFMSEDGQKVLQDIVNKEYFTMTEVDPVKRLARQELVQDILTLVQASGDEKGVRAFVKRIMTKLTGAKNERDTT